MKPDPNSGALSPAEAGYGRFGGLWLLLGGYLGAMLFAALVSPLVFHLTRWLAGATQWDFLAYLADHSFPRFFDRVRWLPLLPLPPLLFWATGIKGLGSLGFGRPVAAPLGRGVGLGLLLIGAVVVVQIVVLNLVWDFPALGGWLPLLGHALLAAMVVAVIEEVLFRGVVLRLFQRALPLSWAVVLASTFFAAVHFKQVPEAVWTDGDPVGLATGFEVAWSTLFSFAKTDNLLPFMIYWSLGVGLSLLLVRTGSLWSCIGVHAGIVLGRTLYKELADAETGSLYWGSDHLVDGLWPMLVLMTWAAWETARYWPGRKRNPSLHEAV